MHHGPPFGVMSTHTTQDNPIDMRFGAPIGLGKSVVPAFQSCARVRRAFSGKERSDDLRAPTRP
jgi:hypothetical protein